MNSIRTYPKRRLILERLSASDPSRISEIISRTKLERLKDEGVTTVFVISSESADTESYLNLIKKYQREGFLVRNNHIDRLDETAVRSVREIVDEISSTFRKKSCLILSYGRSLAPMLVACYYVHEGASPSMAINRVRKMDDAFVTDADEVAFVYKFKRALSLAGVVPEDDDIFKPLPEAYEEELPELKLTEHETRDSHLAAAEPAFSLEDLSVNEAAFGESSADITEAKEGEDVPVLSEEVLELDLDNIDPGLSAEAAHKATEAFNELELRLDEAPFVGLSEEAEKPAAVEPARRMEQKTDKKIADLKHPVETVARSADQKKTAPPKPVSIDVTSGNKLGIYSIRFKLVSIISSIIIVTLTGMILLATYFFKRDNELRAWENNQKFSEVTALKVKSDFLSIIERSRMIPGILGKLNPNERAALWEDDGDFLFIGIAAKRGQGGLNFIKTIYNPKLMGESGITAADIQAAHQSSGASFLSSFNGAITVHNVSQSFRMPVTGFSLPLYRDARGASDQILVSYIRMDRLLKAFKTSGLINVYMVNDKGDIIAHPDSSIIISGGNYLSLPIVKLMMKSPLDNGQLRYDDENGIAHLGSFKKIGIGGCGVIATVSEARAFEQVYRIQRWNFYLLVIGLTIAILVVYIFGKTITTPIQRLVSATAKIKEGHYNVDIRPTTRDEIGLLTGSFIEMGQGLEEREKMKDAFGKFVNKEIADRVLRGEVALGGERKEVAIFFSDIRNFTSISEKLEPEEVVEFLNEYMTRMVNCVNGTRGVVDKFMGDAIMAVWGAPVSTGNDTENAINAALAMRRELLNFNTGRGGDKKPVISIGCGINSGPVLAGQIGSEERMEYTVIGDPVNLASRIESLNKPFGTDILISEDSFRLVKDIYRVVPMQKITVKGKADPQQIFAVLGRMEDQTAPKTIEELRAMLGTVEQPFHRRHDDSPEEDVKYEILEK
jgi:adenylate cyclase